MHESPQDLLREYAQLNRRRKAEGVSPLEYLRWQDLKSRLEQAFPGRPAPGAGGRVRVQVCCRDARELGELLMQEVKPIGLFVRTPFAPPPGERFELRLQLKDDPEPRDGSVTVVSHNVGPGFSTSELGMGVRVNDQGALYQLLVELRDAGAPGRG